MGTLLFAPYQDKEQHTMNNERFIQIAGIAAVIALAIALIFTATQADQGPILVAENCNEFIEDDQMLTIGINCGAVVHTTNTQLIDTFNGEPMLHEGEQMSISHLVPANESDKVVTVLNPRSDGSVAVQFRVFPDGSEIVSMRLKALGCSRP